MSDAQLDQDAPVDRLVNSSLPIRHYRGTADDQTSDGFSKTTEAFKAASERTGKRDPLESIEIEGVNHGDMQYRPFERPELYQWLLAQARHNTPRLDRLPIAAKIDIDPDAPSSASRSMISRWTLVAMAFALVL